MSLMALDLGPLRLKHASDDLNLSVSSTVGLRLPSGKVSLLRGVDIIKALTSGNIWASRGRACRLEFRISFNGKQLDQRSRRRLLESLGYHLRDIHLWSQLSLSATLELPQPDLETHNADILLYVNHGTPSASTTTNLKGWLMDHIDVKPPDNVLCADFETLQLELNFQTTQHEYPPSAKRLKHSSQSVDLMSVDGLEHGRTMSEFEEAVGRISRELVKSVAAVFNTSQLRKERDHTQKQKQYGRLLPKDAIAKMQEWLDSHPEHLYPTRDEKKGLMELTGLKLSQINKWFCRYRQRRARPPKVHPDDKDDKDDMLLLNQDESAPIRSQAMSTVLQNNEESDNDMLLLLEQPDGSPLILDQHMLLSDAYDDNLLLSGQDERNLSDDYMLFSQAETDVPLISTTSAESSSFSIVPSKRPQLSANTLASITQEAALKTSTTCTLASVALHILISGYIPDSQLAASGAKFVEAPSSPSISALVPSMFCPGFQKLIAHNSKFLSTISNAISSSWVRNVQGAGLRGKLMELSKVRISELHEEEETSTREEGTVERLSAVVQGRVWGMMQRALFDGDAAGKLKRTSLKANVGEDSGAIVEDVDLLDGGGQETTNIKTAFEDFIEQEFMGDDEESLFEDLLLGRDGLSDENGVLECLGNIKRNNIHAETDEMLFGDEIVGSGKFGPNSEILLSDTSVEEEMLL